MAIDPKTTTAPTNELENVLPPGENIDLGINPKPLVTAPDLTTQEVPKDPLSVPSIAAGIPTSQPARTPPTAKPKAAAPAAPKAPNAALSSEFDNVLPPSETIDLGINPKPLITAPSLTSGLTPKDPYTVPKFDVTVPQLDLSTTGSAPADRLTALAKQGDARAALVLGYANHYGNKDLGISPNAEMAGQWLNNAKVLAGKSNPNIATLASLDLGNLHNNHKNGLYNRDAAIHNFTDAAKGGNIKAMGQLADVLRNGGKGSKAEQTEAVNWDKIGAGYKGNARSQLNLAEDFKSGIGGMPVDLRQAAVWANMSLATSMAHGDPNTKEVEGVLTDLAKKMTPQQKIAVQEDLQKIPALQKAEKIPVTEANLAPSVEEVLKGNPAPAAKAAQPGAAKAAQPGAHGHNGHKDHKGHHKVGNEAASEKKAKAFEKAEAHPPASQPAATAQTKAYQDYAAERATVEARYNQEIGAYNATYHADGKNVVTPTTAGPQPTTIDAAEKGLKAYEAKAANYDAKHPLPGISALKGAPVNLPKDGDNKVAAPAPAQPQDRGIPDFKRFEKDPKYAKQTTVLYTDKPS